MRSIVVGALALLITACGWHAGLVAPEGATRLAVSFPKNESKLRDIEVDVARALAEAALDRLELRPSGREDADLLIRGRVQDFRRAGGIRTEDNRLLEATDLLVVDLELFDLRENRVLSTASGELSLGQLIPDGSSVARAPGELPTQLRLARNLADSLLLDLFDPRSMSAPEGSRAGSSSAGSTALGDGD